MEEGLVRFIKSQADLGLVQGWKRHNDIPAYTHLQFVDDTGLLGRARISEAVNIKKALDIYLKALGQKINDNKSSIYFFNTPRLI